MTDREGKAWDDGLGDTVGQGTRGGTSVGGGALGGTSTAEGATPGSGIPIETGPGEAGDAQAGGTGKPANTPSEQATLDTNENDAKG